MTTSRKTPAKQVATVEEDAVEVVEAQEEEVQAVEAVEVAPSTVSFTAPNTWTAFYGSKRYDFIEGKKYNLSPEAAAWFSK